jgi:hypothetical protein
MARRLTPLALFLLVVVACAEGPAPATTGLQEAGPTTVRTSDTTTVTSPSTSGAPPSTAAPSSRPPAPDFTLQLADGEVFRLAEEHRPVFLLFWAEW